MSLTLFDLAPPAIARVSSQVPALAAVGGADDFAQWVAATGLPALRPAAFILCPEMQFGPNQTTSASRQPVLEILTVLLVVDADDMVGGSLAIDNLRGAVIDALLGWTPDPILAALQPHRWRWLSVHNGAITAQLDFQASWSLRRP